jgi:hypothetical protein
MRKTFKKCVAAYLITFMAFGFGYAQDDDLWGDFDASVPLSTFEPTPAPSYSEPAPSYSEPAKSTPTPSYSEPEQPFYGVPEPSFSEPEPEPEPPSYGSYGDYNIDDSYLKSKVDKTSTSFIKVLRHPRKATSEFQDAIIEGLQVSTEQGKTSDEVIVTCYFIFRDKPTSYFYDINRNDKKLVFEFTDARTGTSPIAALEQHPLKEIIIEESLIDANKDIKGLNPEWHDLIRVTFDLEYVPAFSVTDEANIISFKYRWTTDPSKYQQYIEANKFPVVFWISGGVLGAIGIGTLTYFLLPKKEAQGPGPLPTSDLPSRPWNTPPAKSQAKAKY